MFLGETELQSLWLGSFHLWGGVPDETTLAWMWEGGDLMLWETGTEAIALESDSEMLPLPVVAPLLAKPASLVCDRFGVNSHYSWNDSNYNTYASLLTSRILEAGIRLVRDRWDMINSDPSEIQALVSGGVKFTIVTEPNSEHTYALVKAALDLWPIEALQTIEGWNEPWESTPAIAFQNTLYDGLRADSRYNNVKILGPSLADIGVANAIGGAIASKMDALNIHPYAFGEKPEPQDDGYSSWKYATEMTQQLKPGSTQWYITEAGYHNYLGPIAAFMPPASEAASAIYGPRSLVWFLTHPTWDVRAYYQYEALNNSVQPDGQERHFGLMYADGSPKPEYLTTKALLTTLSDIGGLAGTARVELSGANPKVVLRPVRRSDGSTDLLVWNAESVWNSSTGVDIAVADVTETITLGESWKTAQVLNIKDGASAAFAPVSISPDWKITLPVGPNISIIRLSF